MTLRMGPEMYDLCPVCFWEDDPDQRQRPWSRDGANGVSLLEAQQTYIASGAMGPEFLAKVRSPRPDEPRDPDWRPYEPTDQDMALQANEEAAWEAERLQEEESTARFNAEMDDLRRHAGQYTLEQVESRLQDLGRAYDEPFGVAEVEFMARFLKDPSWRTRHPLQALSWAWRHRRSASFRRRLYQLRTGSFTVIG
jgi:Cysteine-rich CPCC